MSFVPYSRALLAAIQPATGSRATGLVNVQFIDQGAPQGLQLGAGEYITPIVDGETRSQMLYKLAANPASADGTWTIEPTGTIVQVISNLGGDQYNLPAETAFEFDDALADKLTGIAVADFEGGVDSTDFDQVADAVEFETLNTSELSLDLRRAGVNAFPAVVVTFQDLQPADGASTSSTDRGTRTGNGRALYRWRFGLTIFVDMAEEDQKRRSRGSAIMGRLLALVGDKNGVDGECLSNPGGAQILGVQRLFAPTPVYQKYYVYRIDVALTGGIEREDSRVYFPWLTACITGLKPEAAGDEPTIITAGPMCVEMGSVTLTTDPDGDVLVTENGLLLTQDGGGLLTQDDDNIVVNP